MASRAVRKVLSVGILLGLIAFVPVMANAATRAGSGATATDVTAASTSIDTPETPFDTGPLILLLVAGGIGSMGALVREPVPERRRARR
jgi:hypothetical protein